MMTNSGRQKSIKIAVVNYFFPPIFAGRGIQALELAKALYHMDVDSFFLAVNLTDAPSYEKIDGFDVFRYRTSSRERWCYFIYALKVISKLFRERKSFDVVHFNSVKPFWSMIRFFAKLLNKPSVLTMTLLGSNDPLSLQTNSFLWKREGRHLKYYDQLICIADSIKQSCLKAGIPEKKMVKIPCGVDTEIFNPLDDSKNKAAIRKKLSLDNHSFHVLFVGSISYRKGCDTLIKAWQLICKRMNHSQLIMMGPFNEAEPITDPIIVDLYNPEKHEQYIKQGIVFVGKKDHNTVAEYMHAVDVFVLPSREEGLPNVVIEAMSSGLPTIASLLPGSTDELIQDGYNGFLIEPGNEILLADKLTELATNRYLSETFSTRAVEFIHKTFSILKVAEQTKNVYLQTLRLNEPDLSKTKNRV